jgi:hypothetical protein
MYKLILIATTITLAACRTPIPIEIRHTPTIRVMVIDTGIDHTNPKIKKYLATSNDPAELGDTHGHGTHITGLILYGAELKDPVCKAVEVYSCRSFVEWSHSTAYCLNKARELNIRVVNVSGGGYNYLKEEESAIKSFKARIIAAAGNGERLMSKNGQFEAYDLKRRPFYPAALNYSNITVVGNGINQSNRDVSSNYGLDKMVWRNGKAIKSFDLNGGIVAMTGTSQAAAIYTHEYLQRLCDQRRRSDK